MAFMLTNGTFQVNFLKTHVKLVICPLVKAITFLNFPGYERDRTFSMEALETYGCDREPFDLIRYSLLVAQQLARER